MKRYVNLIQMVITISDRWLRQLLLLNKIILITIIIRMRMEIVTIIKGKLNKRTNQLFQIRLDLSTSQIQQLQQQLHQHRHNRSLKIVVIINLLEIVQLKVTERDLLHQIQMNSTVAILHKLVPYRRILPLI